MTLPTVYEIGTASITTGDIEVVGQGTSWQFSDLRAGDIFWMAGQDATIKSINSNTLLTLAHPWSGPSASDAPYEIRYVPDANRVLESTRTLLEKMLEGDIISFGDVQIKAGPPGTEPTYSNGILTFPVGEKGKNGAVSFGGVNIASGAPGSDVTYNADTETLYIPKGLPGDTDFSNNLNQLEQEINSTINNRFTYVPLTNIGGTENSITASAPEGTIIRDGVIFSFTPILENTDDDVYLTVNGGITTSIRKPDNSKIAPGDLSPLRNVLILYRDGKYRAVSTLKSDILSTVNNIPPIVRTETINLDLATNPNEFVVQPSVYIVNGPSSVPATLAEIRRVKVYRSIGVLYQEFHLETGAFWKRRQNGSSWTIWSKDVIEWAAIDASALSASARSMNFFTSPFSKYSMDGSSAIGGGPDGLEAYSGYLVAQEVAPDLVEQKFFRNGYGDVPFIRFVRGGVADTNWIRLQPGLQGQRMVVFGDSIAVGVGTSEADEKGYLTQAARKLGMIVENFGVGGANMSEPDPNKPHYQNSFSKRTTAPNPTTAITNGNLVVVSYGANDWNTNIPIGTIDDTTDVTFYGAMEVGYSNIVALNVGVRVVFCLPLLGGIDTTENDDGLTRQDYRQAIINFCEKYGLQWIDMRKCGINAKTRDELLSDGIHPNDMGASLMAEYLYSQIS